MIKQYQILTSLSCNLRCTYCYETFTEEVNSLDDCKLYIKSMFSRDSEYHRKAEDKTVIIDYIGGEPFLHPKLLMGIMDYCEEIKSEYNINTVIHSFSTNGTLLSNPKCREILEKYKCQIFLGVSIDGTKEKHDKHRLTINGTGSYDNAVKGLEIARKIGVHHIHIKSTFTLETISMYFESFKNLIALKPNSLYMNFAFEEKITPQHGIHIALEMMNSMEYFFSLPSEKRDISLNLLLEDNVVISQYNPMKKEVISPLYENRCGTSTYMNCLGFNRKLYGCNRFVSMAKPGMKLGILQDDGSILHTNKSLKREISLAYKSLPDWCNSCRHNKACSDCVAISYDEGLSPEDMYKQQRQCGFTKAKELVKVWIKQLQLRIENEKISKSTDNQ